MSRVTLENISTVNVLLPIFSLEADVESLPLKMSHVTLHHVLIAVLQEMVTTNVELEPGALSKPKSRHHDLEVLELRREGLLLSLES